jgi:hypothetical protein
MIIKTNANRRSFLAIMLCVCLIIVLSLSYLYIFTHSKHHCTGNECPVCEQIHVAEHIIEQIKSAITTIAVNVSAVFFVCRFFKMTYILVDNNTLVKQKVRLNN